MKDEVYLDSGIFLAFLVRSDRLHGESVTLFSHPPMRWCTSVLVEWVLRLGSPWCEHRGKQNALGASRATYQAYKRL